MRDYDLCMTNYHLLRFGVGVGNIVGVKVRILGYCYADLFDVTFQRI